jgi:hypothetical protein
MKALTIRSVPVLVLALLLLVPAAWAGTRTYKGKNFDASTGQPAGKYVIKAKRVKKDGLKIWKVRVTCSPKKKCTVLRRAKFKLFPTGFENEYSGTFDLKGAACTLSGYVYGSGFETTFNCDDGGFGSISGRRRGGGRD